MEYLLPPPPFYHHYAAVLAVIKPPLVATSGPPLISQPNPRGPRNTQHPLQPVHRLLPPPLRPNAVEPPPPPANRVPPRPATSDRFPPPLSLKLCTPCEAASLAPVPHPRATPACQNSDRRRCREPWSSAPLDQPWAKKPKWAG
jgi:hypothetical protein